MKYYHVMVAWYDKASLPSQGAWIEMIPSTFHVCTSLCRSPHRERGLKCLSACIPHTHLCRSPHRERGLKWFEAEQEPPAVRSLPSQGAWIEIAVNIAFAVSVGMSLPSQGAWIEIREDSAYEHLQVSLPSQGAWIEINHSPHRSHLFVSLPSQGAWIEIKRCVCLCRKARSLPSQGAWIEMRSYFRDVCSSIVAPLTGSVD